MHRAIRLVVGVLLIVLSAGVARADFADSRDWFEALDLDERNAVQEQLTLLGHYNFLVDGQFGRGTFAALQAFQRGRGDPTTGVLDAEDVRALERMADDIYGELGIELVRDEAGRSVLPVPLGLLSDRKPADTGTKYAAPDGSVELETVHVPLAERSFSALFRSLVKPSPSREISYSSFNDQRFVVSGEDGGRRFYVMYRTDGTESVGYSLTWVASRDQQGGVIAVYIASNFSLMGVAPSGDAAKVETPAQTLRTFGAWSLPAERDDLIELNGEIVEGTATDFFRALRARPDARLVVLNSPGGSVGSALVVSREIYRRGMATLVRQKTGCYSACAYMFFAGQQREVLGELGVHQISAEVADLVFAQTTLSDVIDALNQFGVHQTVIVEMLRTPPEKMYVFNAAEIVEWQINRGARVADLGGATTVPAVNPEPRPDPVTGPADGAAYVYLSQASSLDEAERSLARLTERWARILGGNAPRIDPSTRGGAPAFDVRVPAPSLENANALCTAIKQAGGGCYVRSGA